MLVVVEGVVVWLEVDDDEEIEEFGSRTSGWYFRICEDILWWG